MDDWGWNWDVNVNRNLFFNGIRLNRRGFKLIKTLSSK